MEELELFLENYANYIMMKRVNEVLLQIDKETFMYLIT